MNWNLKLFLFFSGTFISTIMFIVVLIRFAKMYVYELMDGRYTPRPTSTSFPNEGSDRFEGMLCVRAELTSMCSHHHQPVRGVAIIGIIPTGRVIGLSKYVRIAQWCARRGQLQEDLVNQIAKEIMSSCDTENVAVYIQMTHGCMENRGVEAHSSLTQTSVVHFRRRARSPCKRARKQVR